MKVPKQPESRADKIIVQPQTPARSGNGGGCKPRQAVREEVSVIEEVKIKEVEERARFDVDSDHES